jgi:hypothetical protein
MSFVTGLCLPQALSSFPRSRGPRHENFETDMRSVPLFDNREQKDLCITTNSNNPSMYVFMNAYHGSVSTEEISYLLNSLFPIMSLSLKRERRVEQLTFVDCRFFLNKTIVSLWIAGYSSQKE